MWGRLERRRAARVLLPVHDRIPNFAGAERAADRLRALREGKHVFMAVPRLRAARCSLPPDPARLRGRLAEAATIRGAAVPGRAVGPEALGHIDLVAAGSVAVNRRGARGGKGGGYSDLEFALARTLGHVDGDTVVVAAMRVPRKLRAEGRRRR